LIAAKSRLGYSGRFILRCVYSPATVQGTGKYGQKRLQACALVCRLRDESWRSERGPTWTITSTGKVELIGSSTISTDDAVSNAIAKVSKTLRNIHWFEVVH